MYGDATNWDEEAYRERILKEREIETLTVFRTAWSPSQNPNVPDSLVAATSDGSIAAYSISRCISQLMVDFSYAGAQQIEPYGYLRAHDGPAYDVKFYETGDNSLLLSCGDDGCIKGWRWKEVSESDMPLSSQGNEDEPILNLVNPQHKGPWGSLSPIPESNAIAVNSEVGSIFSAAGDSCAYCWDVETGKIKMTFNGHKDYLHCIVARNSTNQIITGSEDGSARIWDCKSGKMVQEINLKEDRKLQPCFSSVSTIALDASETWLACSNGRNLSIWSLPASEFVSRTSTHAPLQDIVFDDNHIVAVGAEPLLSRFDMNGAVLSQVPCAPQSAFSISLHPSGAAAVGGYGGLIDIISQFGSHYCVFRCRCA